MRALRLALDSRLVRCVTCACTATAPLAINPASNTPATRFTLDLKPNINDYSCTSLALLLWNSRPAGWKPNCGHPLLEHPPPLKAALNPKEFPQDGEKKHK